MRELLPTTASIRPGRALYSLHGSHPDSADKILREAFSRAGIIGASTHSGRHTALIQMSNAGIPSRVIQEISGHSNLEQLQRYLEVSDAQVRGAICSLSMLSYTGKLHKTRTNIRTTFSTNCEKPVEQECNTDSIRCQIIPTYRSKKSLFFTAIVGRSVEQTWSKWDRSTGETRRKKSVSFRPHFVHTSSPLSPYFVRTSSTLGAFWLHKLTKPETYT